MKRLFLALRPAIAGPISSGSLWLRRAEKDLSKFVQNWLFNQQLMYNPQVALIDGYLQEHDEQKEDEEENNPLNNHLWFGAPKSKVSPSRKKQKHTRFFPDKVHWLRCEKCGDAKRPHRICTEHLDICAMRPDEYKEHLREKALENKRNMNNNPDRDS